MHQLTLIPTFSIDTCLLILFNIISPRNCKLKLKASKFSLGIGFKWIFKIYNLYTYRIFYSQMHNEVSNWSFPHIRPTLMWTFFESFFSNLLPFFQFIMDPTHCRNEVLSYTSSKHYIIMRFDLSKGFWFYMGKNVQN
jgi:hypothetical protein